MDPAFWGFPVWLTLHITAFTYPDDPAREMKSSARNFVRYMADNLPCGICTKHMMNAIEKGIPDRNVSPLNGEVLSSRLSFFRWTYDFHCYVSDNKMLLRGMKRKKNPTFESVVAFYNSKLMNKEMMLVL